MQHDKPDKQVNVRITSEQLNRLHAQAAFERRPYSWVIREAIQQYCDRADEARKRDSEFV
jgi:predicted DNA binding CopG/RHH family protein